MISLLRDKKNNKLLHGLSSLFNIDNCFFRPAKLNGNADKCRYSEFRYIIAFDVLLLFN